MRMMISVCMWLAIALLGAVVTVSAQDPSAVDPITVFKTVDKVAEFYLKVLPKVMTSKEFIEGFGLLSKDDEAYDPNFNQPGMPQLPAHCIEALDRAKTGLELEEAAECVRCFEPAYENLKKLLYRFEKLRRISASTLDFGKRAIALGDSVCGLPYGGLACLAWQKEKRKIEQSMKDFGKTYDRKYEELIGRLEEVLKEIAECEEKFYEEKDWYDRFGFIYYQFIAARYMRSN
jgi:hypothetical protein